MNVRNPHEFAGGHVPGSINVPLADITADYIGQFLPEGHADILVICQTGRRSAEAVQLLTDIGYTRIHDIGGIVDWPGILEVK